MSDDSDEEWPVGDHHLIMLVDAITAADAENEAGNTGIGVTLLVGGALISGVMIGFGAYLDATAERWRRMEDQGDGPGMAELFAEEASRFREEAEIHEVGHARYVHLREARFVHPSGLVPTLRAQHEGMLMRIEIARIDGFAIGVLSPAADSDE